MSTAIDPQRELYTRVVQLPKPLEIWTPDGSYRGPTIIDRSKMPTNQTLFQTTKEAKESRYPLTEVFTSGEWFQILLALETMHSPVAGDMVTGPYERTSTLLDYEHGTRRDKWHDGLVIQLPEFDGRGNFVPDEKGIPKGRHIWEMALPIESICIENMPPELDEFLNTIYGMENARKQLPGEAYFYAKPLEIRNLLRGYWDWPSRGSRRANVGGTWRPSRSSEDVASRVGGRGKIIPAQYVPDE